MVWLSLTETCAQSCCVPALQSLQGFSSQLLYGSGSVLGCAAWAHRHLYGVTSPVLPSLQSPWCFLVPWGSFPILHPTLPSVSVTSPPWVQVMGGQRAEKQQQPPLGTPAPPTGKKNLPQEFGSCGP